MTLQQLRYVTAIAETGTLSEAARRFYIAQPSLTASLRELDTLEVRFKTVLQPAEIRAAALR